MSRRSIFKKAEITEIKREMRNGTKIKELAERLAPKYNLTEKQMLNRLYYVSAHTYMIKRKVKPTVEENTVATVNPDVTTIDTITVETVPTVVETEQVVNTAPAIVGRKVEMYDDHIRIYF
jgi:hypothetical protein